MQEWREQPVQRLGYICFGSRYRCRGQEKIIERRAMLIVAERESRVSGTDEELWNESNAK